MDYFKLFNLPKKFKINKKLLAENFYQLQLKFHPDLFINHSKSKRKIILEKSIEINTGYKILKNFLSRAIYFLFLNGFTIKKETILLKNNNLLIKYFSLYEELDNLKKNNFNSIELMNFRFKIDQKIMFYKNQIEIDLESEKYEDAIKIIKKLFFFKKIKDSLKQEKISLRQMN